MSNFERLQGTTYVLRLPSGNVGLYVNKRKGILIDSGYTEEEARWIYELLDSRGVKLEGIINTHAHPDNSGGSSYLKKWTQCKVFSSALEKKILEKPSLSHYMVPLNQGESIQSIAPPELAETDSEPDTTEATDDERQPENSTEAESPSENAAAASEGEPPPNVETMWLEEETKRAIYKPKPCSVDTVLIPKKAVKMSTGASIEIVELGGHTHGHLGAITPDGVYFLGDALYSFAELEQMSIPYIENLPAFKQSLSHLLRATESLFVPTHGTPMEFSINNEVLFNQRQIDMIEDAIALHLAMPRTKEELLALLFASFQIPETIPNFYMVSTTLNAFLNAMKKDSAITIIHEGGKSRWFAKPR